MCYCYESINTLLLNIVLPMYITSKKFNMHIVFRIRTKTQMNNDDLKQKEHKKTTNRTQTILFRIIIFVSVVFCFKNVFIILTVIAYYKRYMARYMKKIVATQYLSFDSSAACSGNVSSMYFSHIPECRLIYLSYKNCIKIRQIFLRCILC